MACLACLPSDTPKLVNAVSRSTWLLGVGENVAADTTAMACSDVMVVAMIPFSVASSTKLTAHFDSCFARSCNSFIISFLDFVLASISSEPMSFCSCLSATKLAVLISKSFICLDILE